MGSGQLLCYIIMLTRICILCALYITNDSHSSNWIQHSAKYDAFDTPNLIWWWSFGPEHDWSCLLFSYLCIDLWSGVHARSKKWTLLFSKPNEAAQRTVCRTQNHIFHNSEPLRLNWTTDIVMKKGKNPCCKHLLIVMRILTHSSVKLAQKTNDYVFAVDYFRVPFQIRYFIIRFRVNRYPLNNFGYLLFGCYVYYHLSALYSRIGCESFVRMLRRWGFLFFPAIVISVA